MTEHVSLPLLLGIKYVLYAGHSCKNSTTGIGYNRAIKILSNHTMKAYGAVREWPQPSITSTWGKGSTIMSYFL